MNKDEVDLVCVYNPEHDRCFYVCPSEHRASVSLRIEPVRNGQGIGVVHAEHMTSVRAVLGDRGNPD
jgi:hypothetical protein